MVVTWVACTHAVSLLRRWSHGRAVSRNAARLDKQRSLGHSYTNPTASVCQTAMWFCQAAFRLRQTAMRSSQAAMRFSQTTMRFCQTTIQFCQPCLRRALLEEGKRCDGCLTATHSRQRLLSDSKYCQTVLYSQACRLRLARMLEGTLGLARHLRMPDSYVCQTSDA